MARVFSRLEGPSLFERGGGCHGKNTKSFLDIYISVMRVMLGE